MRPRTRSLSRASGAHHRDLDARVAQSSDALCPVSFDRGSPFELEAELGEKRVGGVVVPAEVVTWLRDVFGSRDRAGSDGSIRLAEHM
jgi:hypothetical protein